MSEPQTIEDLYAHYAKVKQRIARNARQEPLPYKPREEISPPVTRSLGRRLVIVPPGRLLPPPSDTVVTVKEKEAFNKAALGVQPVLADDTRFQEYLHIYRTTFINTSMQEVVAQIAAANNMTVQEIRGARRTKQIVEARQEAMWRVFLLGGRSLPMIARYFGGRDHTTVLHAIKKMRRVHAKEVECLRVSKPSCSAQD